MAEESKSVENPWNELEISNNITFNAILNEIRNLDKSASLTVGMFHDDTYTPAKGGIFGKVDIEENETSRDALYKYTILDSKKLKISMKQSWINKATLFSSSIDRSVGCMVGMAIGDGVGHPFEFVAITKIKEELEDRPRFSYKEQKYWNEYNRFKLERGQWTDDASMALCIADSLIVYNQYKGSDIRIRFWNWWQNGYNNAFKYDDERETHSSVGLGGNISSSIFSCEYGKIPTDRYEVDHENEDSGNGSLMRLAPIPLFYHCNIENVRKYSFESSFSTHPGYIAAEACSFLAFIIVNAIHPKQNGIDFEATKNVKQFMEVVTTNYSELLKNESKAIENKMNALKLQNKEENNDDDDNDEKDMKTNENGEDYNLLKRQFDAKDKILRLIKSAEIDNKEICWNWKNQYGELPNIKCYELRAGGADIPNWGRDEYNGYPVSPEYWGSYCMDGLSIAMHCVYHSVCFADAIEKCVNMLGDADTTGAIVGQIAGAIYGYQSIVNDKEQKFMVDQLNKWDQNGFAFRAVLLYILGDETLKKMLS